MRRHAWKLALLFPLFAFHLIIVATCSTVKSGSLPSGAAQTFVHFLEGNSLEGIAIHKDAIYVGHRRPTVNGLASEILSIDPDGNVSLFATFDPPASDPAVFGIGGLAIGPGGDVLAAVQTLDPTTHGVWRIGAEGEKTRLPGSELISFPNSLTFDARGNLYVTDSLRFTDTGELSGGIWRFEPDGTSELWIEGPLLSPVAIEHPLGIPPVGANGIAFHPPTCLYVANSQAGQILEIGINPDGSPTEPNVVAGGPCLLTVDGIAVDVNGRIHGTISGFAVLTASAPKLDLQIPSDGVPPVVEVDPATGEVTRDNLAPFDASFDFPLSLAFDGKSVFVTNGALRGFSPVSIPEPGPSVIEVGVGVRGFPVFGTRPPDRRTSPQSGRCGT